MNDQKPKKQPAKDLKVGEGFSETRGDSFRQIPGVPKHNGLNVNNDPEHQRQKEQEKKK